MLANRAATGQSGVVPPIRRVHVRRAARVRVRAFVGPPTEKGEGRGPFTSINIHDARLLVHPAM